MALQKQRGADALAAANARGSNARPAHIGDVTPKDAINNIRNLGYEYADEEGNPITEAELAEAPDYMKLVEFRQGNKTFAKLVDQRSKEWNIGGKIYQAGELGKQTPETLSELGQATSTLPRTSVTTATSPGGGQVMTGGTTRSTAPVGVTAPTPTAAPGAVPTLKTRPTIAPKASGPYLIFPFARSLHSAPSMEPVFPVPDAGWRLPLWQRRLRIPVGAFVRPRPWVCKQIGERDFLCSEAWHRLAARRGTARAARHRGRLAHPPILEDGDFALFSLETARRSWAPYPRDRRRAEERRFSRPPPGHELRSERVRGARSRRGIRAHAKDRGYPRPRHRAHHERKSEEEEIERRIPDDVKQVSLILDEANAR